MKRFLFLLLLPALAFGQANVIRNLQLQGNANGATNSWTNLTDVVLSSGVRLSTVASGGITNLVTSGTVTGSLNLSSGTLSLTGTATSGAGTLSGAYSTSALLTLAKSGTNIIGGLSSAVATGGQWNAYVATAAAPASTYSRMQPIFAPSGTVSYVNYQQNAINEMGHRLDLRSTNRTYAVLGLYADATGQAEWSGPVNSIELWNYNQTSTVPFFAGQGSAYLSLGLHNANLDRRTMLMYTKARGTNDWAHDLIVDVASPEHGFAATRMVITTEGNVIVSNTVRAGAFVGDGSGLTNIQAVQSGAYWATTLTERASSVSIPVPSNAASSTVEIEMQTWNTNSTFYTLVWRANGISGTNTWYSYQYQQFTGSGAAYGQASNGATGGQLGNWRGPRGVSNGVNSTVLTLRNIYGPSEIKPWYSHTTFRYGPSNSDTYVQNYDGQAAIGGSITGITVLITEAGGVMDTGSVFAARYVGLNSALVSVSSNTYVTYGSTNLAGMSDVTTAGIRQGEPLTWDANVAKFVPGQQLVGYVSCVTTASVAYTNGAQIGWIVNRDDFGWYSTNTQTYTPRQAGTYLILGNSAWTVVTPSFSGLSLFRNGTQVSFLGRAYGDTTATCVAEGTAVVYCDGTNDALSVRAAMASTFGITNTLVGSPLTTEINIYRIGQ